MAIDFKGAHFPKNVILYAVYFYVRYAVSYRDLEEIMAERGVTIDHATLNQWVVKYAPLVATQAIKTNGPRQFRGRWTKLISRLKVSGPIFTALSIVTAKPLIYALEAAEYRSRTPVFQASYPGKWRA